VGLIGCIEKEVLSGVVPVPESATVWLAFNPECWKLSVADRLPVAMGPKITVAVHFEEASRRDPQVWLRILKSPGFEPPMAILPIEIGDVPTLLRVTTFGFPVKPMGTPDHETLVGATLTPATVQPVSCEKTRIESTHATKEFGQASAALDRSFEPRPARFNTKALASGSKTTPDRPNAISQRTA
jgi:hypothetical protein